MIIPLPSRYIRDVFGNFGNKSDPYSWYGSCFFLKCDTRVCLNLNYDSVGFYDVRGQT